MKVLIVEDDLKIANAIKNGLEQESIVVDMVHDGDSGYDYAISENYDVIILDVMLPNMDGFEICENIRSEGIKTPVLFLTAKFALDDKLQGFKNGGDDYLTKPFEFEELLVRLRALAKRPQEIKPDKLECADLILDKSEHVVKRQGFEINLSKKEYTLLEYLMENKNTVVSKDQIMENVWNFDADILPNTVEVYIKYLREKIDKPFDKPLLHTVRGFGYKISES